MRLHRFYTSHTIGTRTEIIIDSVELSHQIRNVFRLRKNDSLIVFDGSGSDYVCMIEDFRDESIVLGVQEVRKSRYMPTREVTLYAALVKKDTFEWIVEKATELGVTKIVPIIAERTEKKAINEERLIKIATEASEQSGRGSVPVITPITGFKEAIENISKETNKEVIVFHTDAPLLDQADINNSESISCFIGPEGGWSPNEIALFHETDMKVVSIGEQVLRAETAVVATLSLVMLGAK
jgi:16S rRNA (uracil1498-N3)-methyltransferase